MKTNPLRLPLYILYTLKQVKISWSRRIKLTIVAQKATLLLGDCKTLNYLRKPQSGKNGAIFDKKWLKAQNCSDVHESSGLDWTVLGMRTD